MRFVPQPAKRTGTLVPIADAALRGLHSGSVLGRLRWANRCAEPSLISPGTSTQKDLPRRAYELAVDGIPVTVACRGQGFFKQGFYQWWANPVILRDWDNAHFTNAAWDAHHETGASGYRFIADELKEAGHQVGENRVWRLCSQQRLWSSFAKKRGLNRKAGPPVDDDLVERNFTATRPNQLRLPDIPPPGASGGTCTHRASHR